MRKIITPRTWRTEAGLSQGAVAAMLGITGKNPAATWHKWETGKAEPPLWVVQKIESFSKGRVTTASWLAIAEEGGADGSAHEPSHEEPVNA